MTTITSTYQTLIRPDGTAHAEADNAAEVAGWGELPKGWKWEARTYTRTGGIGPDGGFIETGRERIQ
jgi:hypothetical protein